MQAIRSLLRLSSPEAPLDQQNSSGPIEPTTTLSVPYIPPEIVDTIIDHLYDDRDSLRACSLVCKTWLDPARHHLFEQLQVPYYKESGESGFIPFAEFLVDAKDVRPYIKELTLKCDDERLRDKSGLDILRTPELGPFLLVSIIDLLPSLEALSLIMVDWNKSLTTGSFKGAYQGSWPPPLIRPLKRVNMSVVWTSLPLKDTSASSELRAELSKIDVLHYFSRIDDLRLSGVAQISPLPHGDTRMLRVESVTLLRCRPVSAWIEYFDRVGVPNTLRSLLCCLSELCGPPNSNTNYRYINSWLESGVGERLTSLTIDMFSSQKWLLEQTLIAPFHDLGLHTCTSLQSLSFIICTAHDTLVPSWSILLHVLSHIPSDSISTLNIFFRLVGKPEDIPDNLDYANSRISELDWQSFVDTCRGRFLALECLPRVAVYYRRQLRTGLRAHAMCREVDVLQPFLPDLPRRLKTPFPSD